jgi:hypothetical protein
MLSSEYRNLWYVVRSLLPFHVPWQFHVVFGLAFSKYLNMHTSPSSRVHSPAVLYSSYSSTGGCMRTCPSVPVISFTIKRGRASRLGPSLYLLPHVRWGGLYVYSPLRKKSKNKIVLGSSFVSCVRGIGNWTCLCMLVCTYVHVAFSIHSISNEKLLLAPACCCRCLAEEHASPAPLHAAAAAAAAALLLRPPCMQLPA